jgi:uncharacterized protein YecE (DUF72 family)
MAPSRSAGGRLQAMIRVGVAGWSYPDWEGIVYPARKAAGFDRLTFLARHFDTIEINTSFYRIPQPAQVASWAHRVRDRERFRFTVKLYQGFTHRRKDLRPDDAAAFLEALEPLRSAGRLGAVLIQLPYSFRPTSENREWMESIFDTFEDCPLVTEVRHQEWAREEFFDFLRSREVGFCNIDQPGVARSLGATEAVTSRVGYVRLHGRNAQDWFRREAGPSARYDYLYAEEELAPWADRIRRMAEQTADIFIIANNHYRGKGPLAALTLLSMLLGGRVDAPPDLVAAYPQISPRVIPPPPPPQGRLFRD